MAEEESRREIGNSIKVLVLAQGKTLKELADYLGESDSSIYNLIKGATKLDLARAAKIAVFLGLSLDEFAQRLGVISFFRSPSSSQEEDEHIRELAREEAIRIIEEHLKEHRPE